MSTVETESKELAALNAKLEQARAENKAQAMELNALRTKVAKYADLTPVEELQEEVAGLKDSLAAVQGTLDATKKQLSDAQASVQAAGPALALAAAIAAVKA